MSRPSSGKEGRRKVLQAPKSGDVISYEDLLVAQYLEELRKSPPYTKPTSQSAGSPYLQKLAHTHVVPTVHTGARSFSASSNKPKIDPKFIADPNLWDPATPRVAESGRPNSKYRRRPISAPVYKRPYSAVYGSYRPTSAKSSVLGGKKVKSLYKRQPWTIKLTAFKNGDRSVYTRVAAPTIKSVLEFCTEKLFLSTAARRMFLADGTEIFTAADIPRDAEVFISCGENFKDPNKPVKKHNEMSKSATWTMNGLVWSPDTKHKHTKPKLSKRFRNLIEKNRRRVLVFKNGQGSQGVEIVADPERFEDFLVACTAKLDLGSYSRVLYDWEGQQVNTLFDAPVLDQCLQTWTTPVLGPLWVSKGEGFSPKGVCEFLDGLISYTRTKLKEAKQYKKQLQLSQDEGTREQVDVVAILSMSTKETDDALDIVARDIEDFSNALNHLKDQKDRIEGHVADERDAGYEYTLKHIEKLESDHRMVGTKGIRLKVYENGTYDECTTIYFNVQQAVRGLGHDQKQLMARLLDQCCSCGGLAHPKHSPAIRSVAKKIFTNLGKEITNVYDLESDQEIWLSFGENWKNPFTYVLAVVFDKVSVFDVDSTRRGVRGQLMLEDVVGRDRSSCWEAVHGVPESTEVTEITATSSPEERDNVLGLLDTGEVDVNRHDFLMAKDSGDMLVFGDIVVDTKKQKGSKDLWPSDSQTWMISKNGYIYCRSMPQLVLGVSDQRVATNLGHPYLGQSEVKVEGYAVSLQKKEASPAQQWWFTTEGQIGSQLHPELFLTFLGSQYGNDESNLHNEAEGSMSGDRLCLAVCQKLEGRNNKSQRWAIKQERLDNLGQWKMTKVDNPEWHKRALSWPVDQQGALNSEYDWPMEGFLLPYAPSLTVSNADKRSPPGAVPIRLMVLRNGERDLNKVTAVVGPDLTNMKKDTDKKNKRSMVGNDTDSIDMDTPLHCDAELTVLKLEFTMFLERVTSLLNLPFAARRLFDSEGKEYFDMRGLKRDELVYASCGEPWSDPNLSKAEQQRRHLLANLAGDVAKIKQFVAMRNPEDLVLEVESLAVGSAVQVARSALCDREEKPKKKKKVTLSTEVDQEETEESELFSGTMTAHEMSHQRAEQRYDSRKYPWERDTGAGDEEEVDEEEKQFSSPELYRRFKQKPQKQVDVALQQQKFVIEDGYISTAANRDLVLGLDPGDQESRSTPIVLVRRSREDVYQRWTLTDSGIIQAKYNPQLVLTVSMSSSDDQTATVSLQSKKTSQFGRANQRWHHDSSTGFLHAFHTDSMDKEITAANKANVCTFAVMGGTEVDQPGYLVKMTGERGTKSKSLLVCASCARAMRGRYKLERISGNVDFACSMGNAKDLCIRQIGSFQCLNGKVDLSTHEADHTLDEWQEQLDKLHSELSVRSIARQISAARTPYTVKVLAYKNGEGRMKPGELVVASSVAGILEQATERLELGRAARRLYTSDGQLILDIDDLVNWVKDEYVRDAQRQIRQEARAKRQQAAEGGGVRESLMDKVELDSDDSSEDEDDEEQEQQEVTAPSQTVLIEEDSFQQGYAADTPRSIIDPASWSGVIMIPNSTQEVGQDGMLTRWQLYTTGAGQTKLMVMRPDPDNLNCYQIVGLSLCQAPGAGCHVLNLQADHQIPVIKGDVIAFHFVHNPLIPYEIDQDNNEPPLYKKVVGEAPELGAMLKMNTYKQTGCRKYAVNATITVRREVIREATPTPPPAPKKKRKEGKKKRSRPLPHVEPPPLDLILRYPIEVWASCGENFIKPQRVEASHEMSQEQREARASVSYELDKEKHVLRHMQGRRYEGQQPGQYRATRNPMRPVLIAGHWQEATLDELAKHDIVHQLETHLHELKRSQRPASLKASTINSVQRLYTQPSMKRVLVFPNGESVERAVYVWADNMQQMLDNCTSKLSLRKPAKYLFNMNGFMLQDFSEVERDQLLCVSPNKTFLQPRESQQLIEVKANWGRARKQYGPLATDIIVAADHNPQVDVDAFAPSTLAGGSQNRKTSGSLSDQ